MAKQVTLIATEAISPYNKDEVFTVSEADAKALLGAKTVKVAKFDAKNKDHADALVAQRGKTEDVEPVADKA